MIHTDNQIGVEYAEKNWDFVSVIVIHVFHLWTEQKRYQADFN